jgi:UrcA family protein
MSVRSILALAAGLTLAAAGQVYAQPLEDDDLVVTAPYYAPGDHEIRSQRVLIADLDLSTPAGAYTLLGRIKTAARNVCSPEPSRLSELANVADYEGCMDGAISRAVYDVDAPTLSDAYDYGVRRYARNY